MTRLTYLRTYKQRKMLAIIPPTFKCKFIAGEKPYGPKPYCDKPTVKGSSFCPEHHALCWRPIDPEVNRRYIRWMIYNSRA